MMVSDEKLVLCHSDCRKKLDIRNIILSVEPLQERIEDDMLILGGPKNNKAVAKFLRLISEEQSAMQIDSMIVWCASVRRALD